MLYEKSVFEDTSGAECTSRMFQQRLYLFVWNTFFLKKMLQNYTSLHVYILSFYYAHGETLKKKNSKTKTKS